MKKVYIVGCPRSGSTWLTYLLSSHPDVVALHHSVLFPYLLGLNEWWEKKGSSYITNAQSQAKKVNGTKPLVLKDALSQASVIEIMRTALESINSAVAEVSPSTSVVVDKTPENVRIAESIHQVVPDAYFLHIFRDPRAVFSSQRAASRGWAGGSFPTFSPDAARYWLEDVNAALRIPTFTERYIQVRYEDLLTDGNTEINRLLKWLDCPVNEGFVDQVLADNSKSKMPTHNEMPENFVRQVAKESWRNELSLRQIRTIEYLAGDLMESLGYELTQEKGKKPWSIAVYDSVIFIVLKITSKLPRAARIAHRIFVGRHAKWTKVTPTN